MKTCSQCGECCKWLILGEKTEISADDLTYYAYRGATERQGLLMVYHPCTMLEYCRAEDGAVAGAGDLTDDNLASGAVRARCSVHEKKPDACRMFDGRRKRNGMVFYVPEQCTMAGKRKQGRGEAD